MMTKNGGPDTEGHVDKAAHAKKGLGLSPIQVIAGGGAAAVASVIGGHLGLAGTVVGAFLLSVVSGIALPLIRASLERSHEHIKRVVPRRTTGAARKTFPPMAADTGRTVRATSSKVSAAPVPLRQPWESMADAQQAPRKATTGRKIRLAIGGTAAIFIIGVGSILLIQTASGVSLSHGTSALQSSISQAVAPASHSKSTAGLIPKPKVPAVEPRTVPADPATNAPEQQPVTPTPASDPSPSAEPAAPTEVATPAPSSTPNPAAGLSDGSSGGGTTGGQPQPSPGPVAGDVPAQ